jgi:signal peptidase I
MGKAEGRKEKDEAVRESADTPRGIYGGVEDMMKKKKHIVREYAESLFIAFILAMFIRTFFVQAFKIPTGSMRPTLMEGDRILVNKLIYGPAIPFTKFRLPAIRQPKRGEVIVFIYPEDPQKDFIKRVVGLGGESVKISNGNIYIDGRLLEEPQIFKERYYFNRGKYGLEEKILVPEDSLFVLGDNSQSSRDSRYWGFLPRRYLIGKAFFIYWPPSRIGIIK